MAWVFDLIIFIAHLVLYICGVYSFICESVLSPQILSKAEFVFFIFLSFGAGIVRCLE